MLIFLSLCLASGVPAAPPVDADSAVEKVPSSGTTLLGPGYRKLSDWLTAPAIEALDRRDWGKVVAALEAIHPKTLSEDATQERAFLLGWAHIRKDTPAEAVPLLPVMEYAVSIPAPYLALVRGELFLENLQLVEALKEFQAVPADTIIYARAAVLRAKTLKKLGRTKEAAEVFAEVAARPDPAPGNEIALWALALQRQGAEAYPLLRRLWTHYPLSAEAKEAAAQLARFGNAEKFQATTEERSIRAENLMDAWAFDTALAEAEKVLAGGLKKDVATCRALYVRGRSHYKKNNLSNAITGFADAGVRCAGISEDYGAKSLYLEGTAQFRKKQLTVSAATFANIPKLHPNHSMADDGYTHAGISLQEAGDMAGAQEMWRKALLDTPTGDTVGEATWRLAWSHYYEGNTAKAREVALKLSKISTAVDAVHPDGGRYWHARWAAYPDVNNPSKLDPAGVDAAVAGWTSLLSERPYSFYSILAAARMYEVAPKKMEALQTRPQHDALDRPWEVRIRFLEHPGVAQAAGLARLGLLREAREEWGRFGEELLPDEMAWLTELRSLSGDWLFAHAAFRSWITDHPVGSLGNEERAVIRIAYPDRYWEEVKKASVYDTFEPRLFHALMREESNFNKLIVSHAGARGLSQLMPATARSTAGWMKRSITMSDLDDPQTNLDIGARYLHAVHQQLKGSPYNALAGYNAGPGRVTQWKGEWGNIPTDEFIERIPFRETRGYVKRVMGTWQTYRWFIDEGTPFPNLSKYNHQVLPE